MSNTEIAIDLLHVLEKTEAQRDDLLEALERIIADDRAAVDPDDYLFAKKAIAKAKGEL